MRSTFYQYSVPILTGVLICIMYSYLLTSTSVPSVDLPTHIRVVQMLSEQLLHGNLWFYDPTAFRGWPALHAEGFLPYLLAAVLSWPLSLFSSEPARLSVHLILLFGLALLPCTFTYAGSALLRSVKDAVTARSRSGFVLGVVASLFAFWFINHDQQWFGIGAAAVVNIGLYSQLFGWHLLLLIVGDSARAIDEEDRWRRLAIWTALLIVSHVLTAVFAVLFLVLVAVWYQGRSLNIIKALLAGVGLPGFWLLVALRFSSNWYVQDMMRPQHDFLSIFFRYPLASVLRSVPQWLRYGVGAVDPIHLLLPVLVLGLLLSARARSNKVLHTYFVIGVILLCLLSSGYIAASLGLGLHYYRFVAYLFLFFALILSLVPVLYVGDSLLGKTFVVCMTGAFFSMLIKLPHPEQQMMRSLVGSDYLRHEELVLDYFKGLPQKGRVYFEHFDNYDGQGSSTIERDRASSDALQNDTFLACHYMASRLYQSTGFEAASNAFLQRSIGYRMLVTSAAFLGAHTYHAPFIMNDGAQLDPQTQLAQLRSFGITHVVARSPGFIENLRPFLIGDIVKIGTYSILQVSPLPVKSIEEERRIIIGYYDQIGQLPFSLMEYYFYARKDLFNRFQLVELSSLMNLTQQLDAIIINGQVSSTLKLPQLGIYFNGERPIDHFDPPKIKNPEEARYRQLERYLDRERKLASGLDQLLTAGTLVPEPVFSSKSLEFSFLDNFQAIQLTGVVPGEAYVLNYTYLPYWKSDDAELYRGLGESIVLVPKRATVRMYYVWYADWRLWVGVMLSICAALTLWMPRKLRKDTVGH